MPSSSQGAGAGRVLVRGDAEEDERLDAQVAGRADLVDERIDAELEVARHRGDLLPDALAGPHEQRQDQVARREFGFADQFADERVVAQPAGPGGGEAGGRSVGVGMWVVHGSHFTKRNRS